MIAFGIENKEEHTRNKGEIHKKTRVRNNERYDRFIAISI